MRPIRVLVDVADEALTGFYSNITGAGPWTMTTTSVTDGLAHKVSVRNDSVTNHAAKTMTLTGTDADGKAQTETINAPGTSATVQSLLFYKTLTTVTVSATIGADTFDIGWVDEVATPTIPIDWRAQIAATLNVNVTGTINYTVQQTFDDVFASDTYKAQQSAQWIDITALASKTADLTSSANVGARAVRLITTSYSSTAELYLNVIQVDN